MAKDRHSPYVPGARSMAWQKIKIRPEQERVVGAWLTGAGKAVDLGALLVGVYEGGALRYAGKIGAGFTHSNRAELLAGVAPPAAPASPSAAPRAACRECGGSGPAGCRQGRPVAASGARHPGGVRRLDGRRPRPSG